MITPILELLSGLVKWGVSIFSAKNTPKMIDNAEAKRDQEIIKDATKAVNEGNLDEIRKMAAD